MPKKRPLNHSALAKNKNIFSATEFVLTIASGGLKLVLVKIHNEHSL